LVAALRDLGTVPVDVKLCLDLPGFTWHGAKSLGVPEIRIHERPLAGWRMIMKRALDLSVSLALIFILLPLLLFIAVVVKLDSPGPVLFRQRRFGFNKEPITVYKFRTMHRDACADARVSQARRHDPRVTRIGRLLRRTSLDELPQLLNVLGGSMSLVGPRPHAVAHDEQYAPVIDGYLRRHRVKPGITGWAQVNGFRGETDTVEKMEMRVAHDLHYIDHCSLLFDLRILAKTVAVIFNHRNAY
jgi:putative colanic acid biosynthesis UDP-glucose lipid carrier transferase